ncbi:MAG TPA: hypothetical protein VMK65_07045 [Longimicrobiales bacterium]|nr:hypothetical protein [Longimicrobiales bacterium]
MALDFKRCTDLFLGTERELALALGASPEEVRRLRGAPQAADDTRLTRLADVLEERGRAMLRVAEMLRADVRGADPNDNGGPT